MDALNFARDSPQKYFRNWPAIAGLIAAGAVAFLMCGLPHKLFLSPGELLRSAIERVLIILSVSGITIWGLAAIEPAARKSAERLLMLRTTFDALWFAPLALFVCEDSGWTAAITAVLVVSIITSFRRPEAHSWQTQDETILAPSLASTTIELPETQSWFFPQLSQLCAALCAQTGATASLLGHPFSGAVLVGIGSAMWTWSFPFDTSTQERQLRPSAQRWRRLVILALAIFFTAAGLSRYLIPGYWLRGFGIASPHHSRRGFAPPHQSSQSGHEPSSGVREAYSAVVLWPNETVTTKLIAPLLGGDALGTHSTDPLIIPFDGVYWFYKSPDLRPPTDSREAHGSPENFNIRSTDGRYLSMEAHQNLGREINLACCSRIQLVIRNRDRYPQTVSIVLRLINTALPGKPSLSLGANEVNSTRPWTVNDDRPQTNETLDFPIPTNALIRQFDEITLVFRLDARRADAAAKIGVDRFVLVPRGR